VTSVREGQGDDDVPVGGFRHVVYQVDQTVLETAGIESVDHMGATSRRMSRSINLTKKRMAPCVIDDATLQGATHQQASDVCA
jgi:hypothetical protein